ncbi:Uncharacterised protein [uncultured Comamonas sp.]|nr:Uncharacterised protein [uncultured Comamonas sp.]
MRSWKSIGLMALAGASAAVLTACGSAPIPVATNFDYTTQQKARSAGHWDLMARDVAAQSLNTLEGVGVLRNVPVYVALPKHASEFDEGFREMLLTKLVQNGVSVLDNARGADLQISYTTQVVVHKSDRPYFIPGKFTVLAGGLMAAYGLRTEHLDTKLLATLGLAGAADFAESINAGGPTHTEVILTTSVKRGDQYLARKTDVYYLEDVDAPLFWKQVPPAPVSRFNVVNR